MSFSDILGLGKTKEKNDDDVKQTAVSGRLTEATGAADAAGVPVNAVGWNDEEGTVTLGGERFVPAKTPDGKAYVDADAFEAALKRYKNSTGIKSGAELAQIYSSNSGDIDKLSKKLAERKEWTYDPQSDPAYKAYLDAAVREGKKAFENVIGKYTARTGGMMNSAGLTAASESYNNYLAGVNNKVPELMENSYKRYAEDYGLTEDAMRALLDRAKQDYEKNRDAAEFAKNTADENFYRQDDRVKAYLDNKIKRAEAKNADKTADNEAAISDSRAALAENEVKLSEQKLQKGEKELSNTLKEQSDALDFNINLRNYYLENALNRGYFTAAEAEFLGVDENSSPYDIKNRYFENVTRKEIETQEMLKNYYQSYYGQ